MHFPRSPFCSSSSYATNGKEANPTSMFTFYEMTARKENTYHDEGVVSRSASGQKKNGSGRFLRQRVSICNVEVYDYAASWKSEFWSRGVHSCHSTSYALETIVTCSNEYAAPNSALLRVKVLSFIHSLFRVSFVPTSRVTSRNKVKKRGRMLGSAISSRSGGTGRNTSLHTQEAKRKHTSTSKNGPSRESNSGPLAPKARIIPLDHKAT